MIAQVVVHVHVRVVWWVRWYLAGVEMMARACGLEPHWAKVLATVQRGIQVKGKP